MSYGMTAERGESSASGRDRILAAASALFLTRGYAETSLRTIADAAGMQPASIYHHFSGKDVLLTEILRIGMIVVNDAFDRAAAAADPDDSGRSRLERHVTAHLDALFAHQSFTAAHVTVFPFVPEPVRESAVTERDDYERRWTELLSSIAPDLDEPRIQLARLAAFGVMNATIQWFDPTRGDPAELGAGISALLWDGIGSTGDR